MKITEVRITPVNNAKDRLRAYCSITLNRGFAVHDIKIVEGDNGLFISMPKRKNQADCHACDGKNHLLASYCNKCGVELKSTDTEYTPEQLFSDIAHPINRRYRKIIEDKVISMYRSLTDSSGETGKTQANSAGSLRVSGDTERTDAVQPGSDTRVRPCPASPTKRRPGSTSGQGNRDSESTISTDSHSFGEGIFE